MLDWFNLTDVRVELKNEIKLVHINLDENETLSSGVKRARLLHPATVAFANEWTLMTGTQYLRKWYCSGVKIEYLSPSTGKMEPFCSISGLFRGSVTGYGHQSLTIVPDTASALWMDCANGERLCYQDMMVSVSGIGYGAFTGNSWPTISSQYTYYDDGMAFASGGQHHYGEGTTQWVNNSTTLGSYIQNLIGYYYFENSSSSTQQFMGVYPKSPATGSSINSMMRASAEYATKDHYQYSGGYGFLCGIKFSNGNSCLSPYAWTDWDDGTRYTNTQN